MMTAEDEKIAACLIFGDAIHERVENLAPAVYNSPAAIEKKIFSTSQLGRFVRDALHDTSTSASINEAAKALGSEQTIKITRPDALLKSVEFPKLLNHASYSCGWLLSLDKQKANRNNARAVLERNNRILKKQQEFFTAVTLATELLRKEKQDEMQNEIALSQKRLDKTTVLFNHKMDLQRHCDSTLETNTVVTSPLLSKEVASTAKQTASQPQVSISINKSNILATSTAPSLLSQFSTKLISAVTHIISWKFSDLVRTQESGHCLKNDLAQLNSKQWELIRALSPNFENTMVPVIAEPVQKPQNQKLTEEEITEIQAPLREEIQMIKANMKRIEHQTSNEARPEDSLPSLLTDEEIQKRARRFNERRQQNSGTTQQGNTTTPKSESSNFPRHSGSPSPSECEVIDDDSNLST